MLRSDRRGGEAIIELPPEQLRELARLIADELRSTELPRATLVDAAAVAVTLGVSRAFVYEHAEALGAVRLGGKRGRLRFDLDRARAAFAEPPAAAERERATRLRSARRASTAGSVLRARPRATSRASR